jgi:hypothetical protein
MAEMSQWGEVFFFGQKKLARGRLTWCVSMAAMSEMGKWRYFFAKKNTRSTERALRA